MHAHIHISVRKMCFVMCREENGSGERNWGDEGDTGNAGFCGQEQHHGGH